MYVRERILYSIRSLTFSQWRDLKDSEILVKIATFSYPIAFNAPVGGVPIGIPGKSLVLRKLESCGYQAVKTI